MGKKLNNLPILLKYKQKKRRKTSEDNEPTKNIRQL